MIKINKNVIFSKNKRPIIVAEISANHAGSKSLFLKLIRKASASGADLVKIQSYEPKDITLDSKNNNFKIKSGIWKNKFLWELYKKTQTPFSWHDEAFALAKRLKINLFSTPFSLRAVDLLEKYKVKIYKIASLENDDFMLIEKIAKTKKPIILSTGASDIKKLKKTLKLINKYHNKVIILHCVTEYPTNSQNANILRIKTLQKIFKNNLIGISDHTNDIDTSLASISLGAAVIEKHFKLDNIKSMDSKFSINSEKMKRLRTKSEIYFNSLGSDKIEAKKSEFFKHKRSLFAKFDIKKNERLNSENIFSLRPKIGVSSSEIHKILNKKAKRKIKKNSPIYLKDIMN